MPTARPSTTSPVPTRSWCVAATVREHDEYQRKYESLAAMRRRLATLADDMADAFGDDCSPNERHALDAESKVGVLEARLADVHEASAVTLDGSATTNASDDQDDDDGPVTYTALETLTRRDWDTSANDAN